MSIDELNESLLNARNALNTIHQIQLQALKSKYTSILEEVQGGES